MTRLRKPLVVAVLARDDSTLGSLGDLVGRKLSLPPKLTAVAK